MSVKIGQKKGFLMTKEDVSELLYLLRLLFPVVM